MLGLFDSGSGGLNTVRYVKERSPYIDLVYYIDRANAPYGIKSEKEIARISEENIYELVERGAERVLIACCTASTVYDLLDEEYKRVSIPIITPVAGAAKALTETGNIAVIATKRTVSSHQFKRSLPGFNVTELATQELVAMIDGGVNDDTVTAAQIGRIKDALSPLYDQNIDTLILGCTHFPALKSTFHDILSPLGVKNIVDSAKIGADILTKLANY